MQALTDGHERGSPTESEYRFNAKLLPVWLAGLVILYLVTGYRGWLVFLLGLGGAWLTSTLWVFTLKRSLQMERKIHLAWATVGESVPEQLKIINRGWLPAIWVEIVDTSASLETPIRLVSDVAPRYSRTRNLSHLFKRRGFYELGPTRLRTGDPFGIYTLTIHDRHSSTVLVTPPVLPLSQLKITPGGWAGDQRQRRSMLERNISDAGIRNYLPGDSLRRIHWPASAHFDALMVRQLEAATSGDWWIFVDLEKNAQAGRGQDSTLELSIVLAASLAMRGMRERRRVGLALAGPNLTWLEPHADPAHQWRILRALAMAEAGPRSLAELLAFGNPSRTATLLIITPAAQPGWVAALARGAAKSATVLLVDPQDFGSPFGQGRVAAALAHAAIPYVRIPRTLLETAYSPVRPDSHRQAGGIKAGQRYLQQGSATWQSMG